MKTRCRSYGTRQRMTAGALPPSKQDSTSKDSENCGNLTYETAGKDSEVLHETRSQKQASKKRLHEDHAETTKGSSLAVVPETASNSVGVATRSSTRPSKRIKLSSPSSSKVGNQENGAGNEGIASSSSPQTNRKKKQTKRPWESWGKAEKDTFFEALHEYGKDFDRICNFIATKHKRRGDPPALIKNKDQVRHFYYRSLNKIAKYLPADQLSESDNQKKMVIELKGLICYGELRKKICGWNDKHGKKLEELLSHGTISIRNKGRNFKIKAPVCRALKRLTATAQGREESDSQSLAMPSKLTLELLPHNHAAWAAVQRLSKNPRIRTLVLPKKPLSLMLSFFMKKWHVVSRKTLEPLSMCIVVPPDFYGNCNVGEQQAGSPPCKAPSGDLCTPDAVPLEDVTKTCSPLSVVEEKCSGTNDCGVKRLMQTNPPEVIVKQCNNTSGEPMALDFGSTVQADKTDETVPSMAGISQGSNDVTMEPCSVEQPANQGEMGSCNEKHHPTFWTVETCANVTFGELFCKLGRPPKLKLEYTWHDIEDNLAPSQTAVSLTKLVDVATVEFTKGKEGSRVSKTTLKSANSLPAKNSSQTEDKEKGTPKEKAGSKAKGSVAKTSSKLPFILPSVVAPATQTSNETILSDLLPLSQTRPKGPRMQKRQQRPPVHRTLLPRPVGSPSAVPPGAVAVSFIPQPGQTVGTILAAGVSTSTVTMSTQSKTAVLSRTATGTLSSPDKAVGAAHVDNPSPQALSPEHAFTNTNSTSLDLGMSGFADTDLLDVMDQFVGNPKPLPGSVATTSNSVDSIIGLALGTALDSSGTATSIAGINEDSNSAFLASLSGLKPSNLDLTGQSIETLNSSTALSTSEVHIEELNSGVAGGSVPTSLASPTLENILNPVAVNGHSPISTGSDVFFSITEPISSIVDSPRSQPEALVDKESMPVGSLLSPTTDNGLTSTSFPSQWLNGESSNLSIGSLLDKLTTSPKKDDRTASMGESAGGSTFKEPAQEPLLSCHHLLDAETALHAMMDENSVDFVRKFQDLAKEVAAENNSKTSMSFSTSLTFPALASTEANSRSSDDSNSDTLNFRSILRQTNMNGS